MAKHRLKSRYVKGYYGYSLKPERIAWLESIGKEQDLVVLASKMPTALPNKKEKCSNPAIRLKVRIKIYGRL